MVVGADGATAASAPSAKESMLTTLPALSSTTLSLLLKIVCRLFRQFVSALLLSMSRRLGFNLQTSASLRLAFRS